MRGRAVRGGGGISRCGKTESNECRMKRREEDAVVAGAEDPGESTGVRHINSTSKVFNCTVLTS